MILARQGGTDQGVKGSEWVTRAAKKSTVSTTGKIGSKDLGLSSVPISTTGDPRLNLDTTYSNQ